MGIYKKRIVAFLIDALLLGIGYELLWLLLSRMTTAPKSVCAFLLLPFICRDIFFKNASLGKKFVGIMVFDQKWQKPTLKTMLKRAFLLDTVGYVFLLKEILLTKSSQGFLSHAEWELNTLNTLVVDKELLRKIKDEIPTTVLKHEEKMTLLYLEYMRETCCKK